MTETGLRFRDLIVPHDEAAAVAVDGKHLSVHYTGVLEATGDVFDTSLHADGAVDRTLQGARTEDDGVDMKGWDRGNPLPFELGAGAVIAGWDEGIYGMKVGGKRELLVPPELGYGEAGAEQIPPDATLRFEVELLEVREPPTWWERFNYKDVLAG